MLELMLGGARSGKSRMAERSAIASGKKLIYIATAMVRDSEMAERIRAHQLRRDRRWQLLEEPIELAQVLQQTADHDKCIVVDCLTMWLSNIMFCNGGVQLESHFEKFLAILADLPGHIILVSNCVGLGVVPMGESNRQFVDRSGMLEQSVAARSDRVTLVMAGLALVLKDFGEVK